MSEVQNTRSFIGFTCCSRPDPFWLAALLILLRLGAYFSWLCRRISFSCFSPRQSPSKKFQLFDAFLSSSVPCLIYERNLSIKSNSHNHTVPACRYFDTKEIRRLASMRGPWPHLTSTQQKWPSAEISPARWPSTYFRRILGKL